MNELKDVKPGDVVIISSRWQLPHPVKVDRVTTSQIVIGRERFRRESGRRVGAYSYDSSSISTPKEGEVEECLSAIRLADKRSKLRDTQWTALPVKTIEAVFTVLHAEDAPKEVKP